MDNIFFQDDIKEKIFRKVLNDAEERRYNAHAGGEQHDGGASKLEDQVKFYQFGQENILPDEWLKYYHEVMIEQDPEYTEYIRLKNKFEGI